MAKRSRVYAAAIWLLLFSPIMIKAQNLGLSLPSYIGVPQNTALNLPVTVSNFSDDFRCLLRYNGIRQCYL